jgi:copper resistance protein D
VALFLDLFDYLALILHGFALVGQTVAIGSVAFLLLIAQPLLTRSTAGADKVRQGTIRILAIAGGAIAVLAVLRLGAQLATMVGAGIPLDRAFGAGFVVAWSLQGACGVALAALAGRVSRRGGEGLLILFTLGVLAGSIATSHAVGRIEDRSWLLLATAPTRRALAYGSAACWRCCLHSARSPINPPSPSSAAVIRRWRYSGSPRC